MTKLLKRKKAEERVVGYVFKDYLEAYQQGACAGIQVDMEKWERNMVKVEIRVVSDKKK